MLPVRAFALAILLTECLPLCDSAREQEVDEPLDGNQEIGKQEGASSTAHAPASERRVCYMLDYGAVLVYIHPYYIFYFSAIRRHFVCETDIAIT